MTPHGKTAKHEIGVRELRDDLSRYVEHVSAGGEVVVTVRGRRVARLVPIEVQDPLADLRRRGLVQEPTRPKHRADVRKNPRPSGSVSELVVEERRRRR